MVHNQQIEYYNLPLPKVNVAVQHVLSIEIEHFKREFIKSAHTAPGEKHQFCLFDDVGVMNKKNAFCFTCNKNHRTDVSCDVFYCGPSCKNISYENANMQQWADCYNPENDGDDQGCSGYTYKHGFKKAIEVTCPAIAFFENTKGVADSITDSNQVKQRPRVEELVCVHACFYECAHAIYLYHILRDECYGNRILMYYEYMCMHH